MRERCEGQTLIPKWDTGLTPTTNMTIPNSVTSIGDYAFNYCSSLTTVTIGSGTTSIGVCAFGGSSLATVNYRGTKAQWSKISISLGNDCIKKATYTGK